MNYSTIKQDYSSYSPDDHQTWSILSKTQIISNTNLSKEYILGYDKLQIDCDKIVNIDIINKYLDEVSGWTLVPVYGLIPAKDFFHMLAQKRFPVTISIRKPFEIDFSEQPDIFHDVCGHVPLLLNEKFSKFLTAFSIIALRYVNNEKAVTLLGRFFWFTYEMGLINENGELKSYGGAIITSKEEIANSQSAVIPKRDFDIKTIFENDYSPYKLQNTYFIISSFDDLFNCLENLESILIEQLLLNNDDNSLRNYSLNENIGHDFNNVIGFLNDIQFKYPNAISFVAGQPDEAFFEIENNISKFDVFINYVMSNTGNSRLNAINSVGQYNKTKGIINDILAEFLKKDENIFVQEQDILVTLGAQEAFSIILSTLCNRTSDVILVEDPCYIGVSSFAKVFDYNIDSVSTTDDGIDLDELRSKIVRLNSAGKRVKVLYTIPDYQNPSGACMPIGNRLRLLELAKQYNFVIIEDSVYNSFTYAQKKNPTLKSLDKSKRVVFVGSFSKSLFPGLRIGFIVADQQIENDMGHFVPLIDQMAKVKAQLTNNTPTITQAILGGVLLDLNYSLQEWSKPKYESYKRKRNKMLECLDKYVKSFSNTWARDIMWNEPDGGFFIKMTVPFLVTHGCVVECANKFGVIFCPMKFFYLKSGGEYNLRLTFSNVSLDLIENGVIQFAEFLKAKSEEVQTESIEIKYAFTKTAEV